MSPNPQICPICPELTDSARRGEPPSKTLTAVTAARLHQRRRLDLDAEVQRYVPAFPRKSQPITLRQLGGHLAGIRHYERSEPVNTRHYDTLASSLALFKNDALVAKPGERFSYSSYGFNLLGAAIEGAAGQPFGAAVQETVTRPLRMTRTSVEAAVTAPNRIQASR
jgi:serine beta-lactamase-like protein LACTB, mitochondrial